MKKFYTLCMLLSTWGLCSLPLTSCSSSDDEGGPQTSLPENSFSYDNATTGIGSVVYTFDETNRTYAFYFSPTKNIVDLEAMLLADDYILITTAAPTGNVDLLASGNTLLYKEVKVSSENSDNVANAALTLQLTSQTTVTMTLDAAMKSGEALAARYNGICSRETLGDDGEQGDELLLDRPMFSWWRGASQAGTNNYYFAVSNVPFVVQKGTMISLTEPGYALVIDCYSDSGDEWRTFPTGTFAESNQYGDHTYYDGNSLVAYFDGTQYTTMHLTGDITITRKDENTLQISTTYVDMEGVDHPVSFEGDLRVGNGTTMPTHSQMMADMQVEGFYAEGSYLGDFFATGGGLVNVTIYDQKADNDEPYGTAVDLAFFGTKFANPAKERELEAGTYTVSDSYKKGTWMTPVELQILGAVFPLGTYALYDDQSSTGLYAYGSEGTIEIKDLGNSDYELIFDLISQAGYKIQGSYKGDLYLENASNDNDDDGSSTLTEDLNMDLNYLEKAYCYPQTQIYIGALGYRDIKDITTFNPPAPEPCGYQFIDIGLVTGTYAEDPDYNAPGKLVEGDIIRLDLLVAPGDEDKITPGTYTISANRYPASMYPGVCLRGVQVSEGHIGTRWLGMGSAIGNGNPSYHKDPDYFVTDGWLNVPSVKGYASLYEGTVTITKADGGDNWFTFEVNAQDVRHHNITGTWTGPVVLGGTDTPVVSSGKEFSKTTAKTTAVQEKSANKNRRIPNCVELKNARPITLGPVQRVEFR